MGQKLRFCVAGKSFPLALRLHNQLNHFAHGAIAIRASPHAASNILHTNIFMLTMKGHFSGKYIRAGQSHKR